MTLKPFVHYSDEFEEAVLGAILMDKSVFPECYKILKTEMFYREWNKLVFETIYFMFEQGLPIDLITTTREVAKKNNGDIVKFKVIDDKWFQDNSQWLDVSSLEKGEIGMSVYLFMTLLTNRVAGTAHAIWWSRGICEMYYARRIEEVKELEGGKDIFERISALRDELAHIMEAGKKNEMVDMNEGLVELIHHMEKVKDSPMPGLSTGWKKIDEASGGMDGGDMIIVAARPGVGKSSFLNKMMIHAAGQGKNIVLFNLEMLNKSVMARLASIYTGEEFSKIYRARMSDDEMNNFFNQAIKKMQDLPITISDVPNLSVMDIKANLIKLNRQKKIDCVYIDYIALLDVPTGINKQYNREQEISRISRQIKLMAMEFDIPIVVACQLNRQSEARSSKMPILADLRESGSLEQDASGVIILHRDYISGILQDANGHSTENDADIIIAKWRNGSTGKFPAKYDGKRMKFIEIDGYESERPMQPITPPRDYTEPRKDEPEENLPF